MAVKDWSTTASSNTGILTGLTLDGSVMTPPQVDNAFRDMAAQIASQLGKMGFEGADIASATTTNLANATGWSLDITGTTTITGFGTVDAGQLFILRFTGALTLTHNASSLILPGAANITTAAGDIAWMKSEGSGNWRCVSYQRSAGIPVVGPASTDNAVTRFDGTSGAIQNSGVIISDVNAITGVTGLSLSSATPDINFTDTDTNADSRISANSALGGLIIQADVNNEVANTTIAFQIDGSTKVTFSAAGDIAATSGTFAGVVTSSERFVSTGNDAVIANNGSGSIIFRVNGQGTGANATTIDNNGDMVVLGSVTATSFAGSGASLTNLPASQVTGNMALGGTMSATTYTGSAAGLTNIGTPIAALAVGAVGTYALCRTSAGTLSPGDTVTGGQLAYTAASGDPNGGNPSGVWRCMGKTDAGSNGGQTTLFLRIL